MNGTATFSECGTWRYELRRLWGDPAGRLACFLMLNPSTATADADDPTIRRCIGYAKREQMDGLIVLNVYALRSTDPRGLLEADDPVGPNNDQAIILALADAALVVCAWGAFRAPKHDVRIWRIRKLLKATGVDPLCLGVTADGSPRHPLYVRGDAPLIPWRPR